MSITVLIDWSEAVPGLEPEELESRSLTLADEMKSGDLVESARLAREADLPEGAKSGALAFIGGVLTAEVNRENIKKVVDYLGNCFYGKTLTLAYKADGLETTIEYRDAGELEQALAAVKKLEEIRIQVTDKDAMAE